MKEIIALRHHLHRYPELSNQETGTSGYLEEFLKPCHPDKVVHVGRTGRIFIFGGPAPGPTTVFRAELDALPIAEKSAHPYRSVHPGISHTCGHDGHMAILAGLAKMIGSHPPRRGRTLLLFQPAEEVEQGARDVVRDMLFHEMEPDAIFSLHNIPGIPMHQLVTRVGSFASASQGMVIRLHGTSCHAGEPEKGVNPASAIAKIVQAVDQLNREPGMFRDITFATVIHIWLGEVAHGTSPGDAEVRLTLRAFENDDMEALTARLSARLDQIAAEENLSVETSFTEVFPATVNHPECIAMIEQASRELGLSLEMLDKPFRWSEDFGYYTEKFPGGYVGLGSGESQPPLHHPTYDFPDEILETGIRLFYAIYKLKHF
jgi:amidohydrolase